MIDFVTAQERLSNLGISKEDNSNIVELLDNKKIGNLVLTRKKGQSIFINDDIKITIVEIKGKQVKLKTSAPIFHDINREEIKNKKEGLHGGNESNKQLL